MRVPDRTSGLFISTGMWHISLENTVINDFVIPELLPLYVSGTPNIFASDAEVRKLFSEGRQKQLLAQGPITDEAIQRIRQSRKYVPSPRLRTKTPCSWIALASRD